ncbi:hypothetical protein HOI26_05190 [Candidatus Woesearchaeota archaeon]|jgi:hypothetical protein|nr:hypothetical protein [Candidatus Woesearchaeota archaeon]MBT5740463.1 hypothetical protein [Candidatus Woesearchaeota archaeon]
MSTVQNKYQIATKVAEIIHQNAYQHGDRNIKGIMLFGSVARQQEDANDIDLLIIHDISQLNELGTFTKYSGGRMVPDKNSFFDNGDNYSASRVLREMGASKIDDFFNFKYELRHWLGRRPDIYDTPRKGDILESFSRYLSPDRLVVKDNRLLFRYGGVEEEVNLEDRTGAEDIRRLLFEQEVDRITKKYEPTQVVSIVEALMNSYGLDMNNALDLQVMNVSLLEDIENPDIEIDRKLAVEQCRDPTFWQTILREGRVYDRTSQDPSIPAHLKHPNSFNLPITYLFPNALEVFNPNNVQRVQPQLE